MMYAAVQKALAEIDRVLRGVDERQVEELLNCLIASQEIVVYGLGREGLVMRSFAMRLMHLGVKVAVVGDMTAPPARPGTLFLVSCGSYHKDTKTQRKTKASQVAFSS